MLDALRESWRRQKPGEKRIAPAGYFAALIAVLSD
jgi:hypothetical protein